MSFIKLEKRISISDTRLGASMSMRIYTASPKPVAFVALRKHFLETAEFKSLRFDVAIGEGASAGKIRIYPNKDGVFAARELKSALVIDLGHVPQLGDQEHKNRSAEVVLVDGAAIVTIPDWSEDTIDDDEDDEADEDERPALRSAAVASPAPYRPQATVPTAPKSTAGSLTHHGVTINLTPDAEAVSYKGNTIEVTTRGARMVEVLAKVMPSCIGDSQLVDLLWGNNRPPSVLTHLDMVVRDLGSLKTIGLEVRTQKGIGRQLVEVKR